MRKFFYIFMAVLSALLAIPGTLLAVLLVAAITVGYGGVSVALILSVVAVLLAAVLLAVIIVPFALSAYWFWNNRE